MSLEDRIQTNILTPQQEGSRLKPMKTFPLLKKDWDSLLGETCFSVVAWKHSLVLPGMTNNPVLVGEQIA